ncbi:hypothetical protein [Roseomonas chloroacetimidivorans]|uniref:hypothetical protein n=1 Tax=Roseomonas chloroacetimidivorans TaxID=1766656 RepID=UPI003C78F58E
MSNLRWKRVGRYDASNRLLRVGRLMWERGVVGDGNGYSAKLSFGLSWRLLPLVRRERDGWLVRVLGLRLHYRRAYGGRFV